MGGIISSPAQPSKLAGLAYMEQTGATVETRTLQALIAILDSRYGKRTANDRGRG